MILGKYKAFTRLHLNFSLDYPAKSITIELIIKSVFTIYFSHSMQQTTLHHSLVSIKMSQLTNQKHYILEPHSFTGIWAILLFSLSREKKGTKTQKKLRHEYNY